jgi:hypothetical protein
MGADFTAGFGDADGGGIGVGTTPCGGGSGAGVGNRGCWIGGWGGCWTGGCACGSWISGGGGSAGGGGGTGSGGSSGVGGAALGVGEAGVLGCGSGKVGTSRCPLSNTIETAAGGGSTSDCVSRRIVTRSDAPTMMWISSEIMTAARIRRN